MGLLWMVSRSSYIDTAFLFRKGNPSTASGTYDTFQLIAGTGITPTFSSLLATYRIGIGAETSDFRAANVDLTEMNFFLRRLFLGARLDDNFYYASSFGNVSGTETAVANQSNTALQDLAPP
eukprot:TRINITY_DN8991_c0_g1_i1.p2 TRINITY_DN8991_c0_g1~~TRINITY_DN8991_c0_g1_i1.p2  ORF type:complete len:122 (+),score=16.36 TRINITY_DN8991_c0_g1_i1:517-882(+)